MGETLSVSFKVLVYHTCGILLLFIKTGRWSNIVYEQRICKLCDFNQVENEMHFLFDCSFYTNPRRSFIENAMEIVPEFNNLVDIQKLDFSMKRPIVNFESLYTLYI